MQQVDQQADQQEKSRQHEQLALHGDEITVADIGLINDLQKSIKANKVISFLGGGAE